MAAWNCWARALGDCRGPISREHVVSQSVFTADRILVSAEKLRAVDARVFGLSALTANILCRHHNSALSELDAEAGRVFEAFRVLASLRDRRAKTVHRGWVPIEETIDGELFERWLTKCAVNLITGWGVNANWREGDGSPPRVLVDVAFGRHRLEHPGGLYTLAAVGDVIRERDSIEFASLVGASGEIVASAFEIFGYRFVLRWAPATDGWIAFHSAQSGAQPLWHLHEIRAVVGGHYSHRLRLTWPHDPLRFDADAGVIGEIDRLAAEVYFDFNGWSRGESTSKDLVSFVAKNQKAVTQG